MLTWLHIGDLHVCSDDDYRSIDELQRIVYEANAFLRPGLDFVFLPGDNANNGLREQYQRINQALAGLRVPVYAIPGDHDFEPGNLDAFATMTGALPLPHIVHLKDHPLLFLDAVSAGQGGPDFQLGEEQRRWLARMLGEASAAATARPVVFMHGYPSDFEKDHAFLGDLFDRSNVALVDTGHTHYNELLNDGRVIYSSTRSTGQIEEDGGRAGFSLVSLDGPHLSWRFKHLGSPWPFVVITSPTDHRLVTERWMDLQLPGEEIRVRAKTFGSGIASIKAWVEGGEAVPMHKSEDEPGVWEGTLAAPPREPIYRLHVAAKDDHGNIGTDAITIVRAERFAQITHRVQAPLGSDAHATRPWPEHGIIGTQLGPNKFGGKW